MRLGAVLGTTAVIALTACGSQGATGPGGSEGMPARPAAAVCPAAPDWDGIAADEPDPLPDDATPVAVLRCTVEARDLPGEGRWLVLVESWADSGLASFVRELRQPDEPLTDAPCDLMLVLAPWFVVTTPDGQVLRAAVPEDRCGTPGARALAELDGLPFTVVRVTRLRQVESAEAQAAGCAQAWKDMPAIEAADGSARPGASHPVWSDRPQRLVVCVYVSDGRPAHQTPSGDFVSGTTLDGTALAAALVGLEGAPPATGCAEVHTTFAVLSAEGEGDPTYVELDGCRRVLTGAHELREAPAALVAALG